MPVITAENLSKTYQQHRTAPGLRGSLRSLFRRQTFAARAVDGVTFAIDDGEIVGFLGPNGAGKTTTIKMLCGILYPSGGRVDVLGHVPARREPAFLRRIALVMGQKNMLWWDIPAMETLLLHRDMYGLPDKTFRQTVDELSAMLDVRQLLGVQVRKLSLGERMKLELLTALVHRPAILFLDEPTIGLDVVAQQRVRDFLRRLNREHRTTILLTSHYMDDIEQLCPRVLVIDQGHLSFDGSLAALVEQAAPQKRVTAVFAEEVPDQVVQHALGMVVGGRTEDPRRLSLTVPREQVADVAGSLLHLGRIVDLSVEEVAVEEIVRAIFQRPLVRTEG